jgi:hypothetical protein
VCHARSRRSGLLLYVVSAAALTSLVPGVPQWLWVVAFVLVNTVINYLGIEPTARLPNTEQTRLVRPAGLALDPLAGGVRAGMRGSGQRGREFVLLRIDGVTATISRH